jgi:hypothetical protein
MAPSPQQLLFMRMALQVFNRMSRATADDGASVLESIASLSISRVLDSLGDNSNGGSSSRHEQAAAPSADQKPAAAAAAAAAGPIQPWAPAAAAAAAAHGVAGDGAAQIAAVNSGLQRHMRLRNIQACAANIVMLDHISKEQIAELCVGELLRFLSLAHFGSVNILMYRLMVKCK